MKRGKRPVVPHPTDPTLSIVQLTGGYFALVSVVDAAEVERFSWHAKPHGRTVYGVTQTMGGRLYLHRLVGRLAGVIGSRERAEVDHANGNGLDCRRSNLRAATRNQNLYNARTRKDNRSGVKGVSFRRGKWRARVQAMGKERLIGLFDTKEEAAAAVETERSRLHGTFANHGAMH